MINIKTYFAMKRHFWQTCRRLSLNPSEIALFLALVDEANEHFWVKDFNVTNGWLTAKIGVSEPTLISARNKLGQYNLISFKSGKSKRKPTRYTITFLENYLNNFSENLSSEQESEANHLNNLSESFSKNEEQDSNHLNNLSKSFSQSFSESFSQSLRHSKDYKTIRHKDYNTNIMNEDFSKNNFEEGNFSENENFENPNENEISEIPVKTEISSPKKVAQKKGSQNSDLAAQKKKARATRKQKVDEQAQQLWDEQIDTMPMPYDSEELKSAWQRYRKNKSMLGKPLTPIQAEQELRNLSRMGSVQIAITQTEKAIAGDWTQIFPPFPNQTTNKNNTQNTKPDFINADYSNTSL